jgi:hypothetical protein
LIDEDGSTINDSEFCVNMAEHNSTHDLPSMRHGSTYQIGFSDGHMESIKWLAPGSAWCLSSPEPDPDWVRLKGMTTVKKAGL